MTKFNTLLRVVCTLGVYLILSQAASAQTVLNFAKVTLNERLTAGFAVTNPTSNYADVQFTYFGLDGNPISSGLVNPVRYRLAPKGQLSLRANELFGGSKGDGWVQVTSATSGLTGFYFSGDFAASLEGSESAPALSTQIIPVIRDDQATKTELVILNPGVASSTVSVTLFNLRGEQAGVVPAQLIPAHGSLHLTSLGLNSPAAGTLTARITASAPVAATAVIDRGDSALFVSGQAIDQPATLRIAPHFITAGYDSVLVLANPTNSTVSATVSLFTETGNPISPATPQRTFNIPANGSLSADIRTITGQPVASTMNGWLRVESGNVPLTGLVILDQGRAMTAVPLQTAPSDRMTFSQISDTQALFTSLVLVNPTASDSVIDVTVVRGDGTTSAEESITIAANSKLSRLLREVVPDVVGQPGGYVVLRSSSPIYGLEMLAGTNDSILAGIPPARTPDTFSTAAPIAAPIIASVETGTDVLPGSTLRLTLAGTVMEPTFYIAGQSVNYRQLGAISLTYEINIPALEPGFAKLVVRSDGVESAPIVLRVLGSTNVPVQPISGQAFYQKIDVTDAGLDVAHPVMVPIRNARVEVVSRSTNSIVAVSDTDLRGRFTVPVPFDPNLTVRVISRLRGSDLRVADNTNQNQLYTLTADFDGRDTRDLLIADTSRMSGAFNIMEMIQRGNDTVKMADPNVVPPAVTVYWSTRNKRSTVGTTYFNVANNTAYVLGDRDTDSDEFDDAVLIHEYAHLLAAKFSRDDSPGGPHSIGDMLDPRLAWSEGWANAFSSIVRNDSVWRDSSGPNGVNIYRFDIEDNVPANDKPGYWSEASVDSLLWDLFDERADTADDVQYAISQIWTAFTDLRSDRFVYLPYFLEHFITRNPLAADAIRTMVQSRSIDFQPGVRPSVAYPFPTPMSASAVSGAVDSLSAKRANLVTSSHFYSFTTTGGAATVRLDIIGLGPADNPNGNDLDLFLMDSNGRMIDRSDSGLNGQAERIALKLLAGTYVVEIRSYYTKAETGGFVFNSGQYRLSVSIQ